jgi:hypothetical protein
MRSELIWETALVKAEFPSVSETPQSLAWRKCGLPVFVWQNVETGNRIGEIGRNLAEFTTAAYAIPPQCKAVPNGTFGMETASI